MYIVSVSVGLKIRHYQNVTADDILYKSLQPDFYIYIDSVSHNMPYVITLVTLVPWTNLTSVILHTMLETFVLKAGER